MRTKGLKITKFIGVIALCLAMAPSAFSRSDSASYLKWTGSLKGSTGKIINIYKKPGLTWKDCKRDTSLCIGWPVVSQNTKLQVIQSKYITSKRLRKKIKYHKINVAYIPKGKNEYRVISNAWIQAKYVKTNKARNAAKEFLAKMLKSPIKNQELNELTGEIMPLVGHCFSKRKKLKTRRPFRRVLRKHWSKTNKKTKNPSFSNEELFAVDALARTIYGEMRSCVGKSLGYPRAVAKVAINRAKLVQKKGVKRTRPFVASQLPNAKKMPLIEILPYVLGSHKQFSTWNYWDRNVRKALCPAKSIRDKKAWEESVKIAVEAIFFKKQFEERTANINGYHYTSGIPAPWRGFRRVQASVDGEVLRSRACFQLWSKSSLYASNKRSFSRKKN